MSKNSQREEKSHPDTWKKLFAKITAGGNTERSSQKQKEPMPQTFGFRGCGRGSKGCDDQKKLEKVRGWTEQRCFGVSTPKPRPQVMQAAGQRFPVIFAGGGVAPKVHRSTSPHRPFHSLFDSVCFSVYYLVV